jgi:hypothetical protein
VAQTSRKISSRVYERESRWITRRFHKSSRIIIKSNGCSTNRKGYLYNLIRQFYKSSRILLQILLDSSINPMGQNHKFCGSVPQIGQTPRIPRRNNCSYLRPQYDAEDLAAICSKDAGKASASETSIRLTSVTNECVRACLGDSVPFSGTKIDLVARGTSEDRCHQLLMAPWSAISRCNCDLVARDTSQA